MIRAQVLQVALEVFAEHGYEIEPEQVTLLVPLQGTVVVHIDVAVTLLGPAAGLLDRLGFEGPIGMHYVVCSGPLVQGAWVGCRRLEWAGDETDSVPLHLLTAEMLADLAVWLDAREAIASELPLITHWQRLVTDERARRIAAGEPQWTWPPGAGSFDADGRPAPIGESMAPQGFHLEHGNSVCKCGHLAGTHQSDRARAWRERTSCNADGQCRCTLSTEEVLRYCDAST